MDKSGPVNRLQRTSDCTGQLKHDVQWQHMPRLTVEPTLERLSVEALHRDEQVSLAFPLEAADLNHGHQVLVRGRGHLLHITDQATCRRFVLRQLGQKDLYSDGTVRFSLICGIDSALRTASENLAKSISPKRLP